MEKGNSSCQFFFQILILNQLFQKSVTQVYLLLRLSDVVCFIICAFNITSSINNYYLLDLLDEGLINRWRFRI